MNAVRICAKAVWESLGPRVCRECRYLIGCCATAAGATRPGRVIPLQMESFVLDIVYVLGIIAVFALVGVIGRGVEKL